MQAVAILPAGELSDAHLDAWSQLQQREPLLAGPYFRPEFTLAVAAVRPGVRVAVLDLDGQPAWFAFQHWKAGVGLPVGGCLSDFHGVVAASDSRWTAAGVVEAAGLRAWHFDHVPAGQTAFEPHSYCRAESPFLDLSEGFEAYAAGRRQSGSKRLKRVAAKARRLAAEAGPLRFVPHDDDPETLDGLLEWKSSQFRRTGQTDLFAVPWIRQLIGRVLSARDDRFQGMLSSLYAGDQLAAVDLGLRSGDVLHSWFPAFNRELAAYWPGHILSLELARAAGALGIRRIEWGKGDEDYKRSFMSGAGLVIEGAVDLRPLSACLRLAWHRVSAPLRSSPLRRPLLGPLRWLKRLAMQRTL